MAVILPGVEDRFLSSDHRAERSEREFGKSCGEICVDGRYSYKEPGTSVLGQLQNRLGSLKSAIYEFKADMNRSAESPSFTSKFSSFSRELIFQTDTVMGRVSRINSEDVHYCSSAIAAASTLKALDAANSEHHDSVCFQELSDDSSDLRNPGISELSDESRDIGFGLSRAIFSPLDLDQFKPTGSSNVGELDRGDSLSRSDLVGGKNFFSSLDESFIGARLINPIGAKSRVGSAVFSFAFSQATSMLEMAVKSLTKRLFNLNFMSAGSRVVSGTKGPNLSSISSSLFSGNAHSAPGIPGDRQRRELRTPGGIGCGVLGVDNHDIHHLFLHHFQEHLVFGVGRKARQEPRGSQEVVAGSGSGFGYDIAGHVDGYFRPIGPIEDEVFVGYETVFNEIVALFKQIKTDVDHVDGKMNTLIHLIKRFFSCTGIDVGNQKCVSPKALAVFDILDLTLTDSKLNERLFGRKFATELMELVKEISQDVKYIESGVKVIRDGSINIYRLVELHSNEAWNLSVHDSEYDSKVGCILKNNKDIIYDILSHVKQIESSLAGVLDVTSGFNRGFLQEVRHIYRNALAQAGEF